MKLKWFLTLSSLFSCFYQTEVSAEARASLFMRAYIVSSISTNIRESKLSPTQSLWMLSSQMNYSSEGQKFEVEGLEQAGLEAHIQKIVASDRKIQYEILISRLKSSMPKNKPIFLKISAN